MVSGLVTNIQRYSLQDGPGIRTTVFLKGCPLDCWWCHNPEGLAPEQEVVRVESRCLRCRECVKACPQDIARMNSETEDREACTHCGSCVRACPTGARQFAGLPMTVADVLQEVRNSSVSAAIIACRTPSRRQRPKSRWRPKCLRRMGCT